MANAPLAGRDGGDIDLILVKREREYFLIQVWTGSITLIYENQAERAGRLAPDLTGADARQAHDLKVIGSNPVAATKQASD